MNIIVLQGWAKPAICIAPPSFRGVIVQRLFRQQILGRWPVVPLTGRCARSYRNLQRLRSLTKVSGEIKLGDEKNKNKFRSPDRLQMNPSTLEQSAGYCCRPWGRYHDCAAESLSGVKEQHGSTYVIPSLLIKSLCAIGRRIGNAVLTIERYCFYSNCYFSSIKI